MSTTWNCHYRRNKPGYVNQWEQCGAEIQHMMICSDPLFTAPIDVLGAAFYLPLGPGGQLYRNISGYFSATGTTGTGPTVPVPNATVGVVLNGYDSNGIAFPLINQNFTSNSNGVATGFFPCQGGRTMIGVSGIISYLSGNLTGVILINVSVSDMPPASLSAVTDSPSANIVYNTSNPINIPLDISVERAENISPFAYTVQTTDTGVAPFNSAPSHTGNIPLFHGYLYRTSFVPLYSTKAVKGNPFSGGAPPPLLGLEFDWSGSLNLGGNTLFWIPTIHVKYNTDYAAWYDGLASLEYKETGSSTWTTAGFLSIIYSGYFLFDVSSLTSASVYDFRASGCHYDSSTQCFWTDIVSGRFNVTQIIASAGSSITGCGVDVTWQGPTMGTYTLQIALDPSMSVGLFTVPGIAQTYYRHDTSASCGQLFYYRVQDSNNFLSNVVSGSGRYTPPIPTYSLSKVGDSGISVDWSAMTATSIDYISGLVKETNPNSIQPESGVVFSYAGFGATVHVPLNPLSTGFTPVMLELYSVFQDVPSASAALRSIELPAP
jgi:hypothetical protein